MSDDRFPGWHGTTILAVRRGGRVVVAGDGQVSVGQTVMKGTARKVRRLSPGGRDVVVGFAGSTADAFTLLERLEKKLEAAPGQLQRACVDLAGNRTWLQQDGKLLYGPTVMSHGKPGQETPKGTFTVTRKVKDEISHEFNNAPMPYAVYFTNNGHAFHEGSTDVQSAGCVRLPHDAAKFFFENLQVGDVVYIY